LSAARALRRKPLISATRAFRALDYMPDRSCCRY
jgi:hypothetical protein